MLLWSPRPFSGGEGEGEGVYCGVKYVWRWSLLLRGGQWWAPLIRPAGTFPPRSGEKGRWFAERLQDRAISGEDDNEEFGAWIGRCRTW